MSMTDGKCGGCGKKVIWGTSETGARVPLDPVPPVYRIVGAASVGYAKLVRDKQAYVSHFSTCPSANQFSRSRRTDPAQSSLELPEVISG